MTDWKLIAGAINDSSVKIKMANWGDDEYDHLYFNGEKWLNESDIEHWPDFVGTIWVEYTEPKPKIKLWQWVWFDVSALCYRITERYYEIQPEDRPHARYVQRAEWTMIEMEKI